MKNFKDRLDENPRMQHAYKARHKEKYYWNEHKQYIINKETRGGREMLDIYTKVRDHERLKPTIEKK